MRKYRFILKYNPLENCFIDDINQVFQITKVLRLTINNTIDGLWNDSVFNLKIINIKNNLIYFEILKEIKSNTINKIKINLLLPILKNDKTELILQKATELGVSGFNFINFEHSVKQNLDLEKKYTRWQKIIHEAVEQSERFSIPEFSTNILNFNNLNNFNNTNSLNIVFIERINFLPLLLKTQITNNIKTINLLFGPEGGFSKTERLFLENSSFKFYSLGENILRAETAIITGLGLISYQLQCL